MIHFSHGRLAVHMFIGVSQILSVLFIIVQLRLETNSTRTWNEYKLWVAGSERSKHTNKCKHVHYKNGGYLQLLAGQLVVGVTTNNGPRRKTTQRSLFDVEKLSPDSRKMCFTCRIAVIGLYFLSVLPSRNITQVGNWLLTYERYILPKEWLIQDFSGLEKWPQSLKTDSQHMWDIIWTLCNVPCPWHPINFHEFFVCNFYSYVSPLQS